MEGANVISVKYKKICYRFSKSALAEESLSGPFCLGCGFWACKWTLWKMAKNKTWGSLQVCTESAEVLNASQYSVV